MDNFNSVAFVHFCIFPISTSHDLPIHLNRNSLRRKLQLLNQFTQPQTGIVKLARLTIDLN